MGLNIAVTKPKSAAVGGTFKKPIFIMRIAVLILVEF
jgi:hypothetical protein